MIIVWGANPPITKGAFEVFPPVVYAWVRFSLAAVLLLLVARAIDPDWLKLSRRDWAFAAIAGFLGVGFFQPLWNVALSLTTTSDNVILSATSPLFVLLFTWLRGRQRPDLWTVVGFVASFAGVLLVVLGRSEAPVVSAPNPLLGNLLSLASGAMWATYILVGEVYMRTLPPLRATAWAIALGALMMIPAGLPEARGVDFGAVPLQGWLALLYGAVLATVFAFSVWYNAVKVLGPVRTMIYQNGSGPLSILLAVFVLGDPISALQIIGMVIVFGGILMTRWPTLRLLLRRRR